ncbi:MAG: serine/threonine protein kinase, partial [Planctomycetes bacterium]|nr:serine/threonine protein kinase [Planctomycetota bacterium]
MATASPEEPEPPDLQQVRRLFDRATEFPASEREAFVRREAAHDHALRDAVLQLLAAGELDTGALRDGIGAADPEASPAGSGQDHVQSTATGELLEKLKTAPRLDRDRFVVEDELGQGGMGVVTRIHDRFLNRRLAMKVLLERRPPRDEEGQRLANQLLGRFLEEAQVTSQLDHPGVVPVHELGLDAAGKVYFTMRLVKGRTASVVFADAFAERGEWNLTRALEVVLKVCDTMAYAHDKGVLHRDLKPANVMVGRFGEVYVMDWGLAKVLGQKDRHDLRIRKDQGSGVSKLVTARRKDAEFDESSSVVSMDGQQLGTPSYMSPEQARSEELDVRADVYSIGAMLYELVTGRAPYTVPGGRKPAYAIL